jgi:hypothetical protein
LWRRIACAQGGWSSVNPGIIRGGGPGGPETTVICFAGVAPRAGTLYGFTSGEQTFAGTVIRVTPLRKAKQHVAVRIELTEAEHRRLTLGG